MERSTFVFRFCNTGIIHPEKYTLIGNKVYWKDGPYGQVSVYYKDDEKIERIKGKDWIITNDKPLEVENE